MEIKTEYRYSSYGNVSIIIISEYQPDVVTHKLLQEGVNLNEKKEDSKETVLEGNSGIKIRVTIKRTLLGRKYSMLINNNKIFLSKISKEEAENKIKNIRKAKLEEAKRFRKEGEKIYPILKPGDWEAKHLAASTILLKDDNGPQIYLGYGYSLKNSFSFLTIEDLKKRTIDDIHSLAMKNINAYEVIIEHTKINNYPIVMASGHDFSSEKILSPDFLNAIHDLLSAKELLVSIPRRTCIMIINRTAPEETINLFAYLHNQAWIDDSFGNPLIYNGLFLIEEGKIKSVFSLDK